MSYDVFIAPGCEARIRKVYEDLNPDEAQGVDEALYDIEVAGGCALDEVVGIWHDEGVKHEIGVVPAPGAPHVVGITSSREDTEDVRIHDVSMTKITYARKLASGITAKSLDLSPNRHWEPIP